MSCGIFAIACEVAMFVASNKHRPNFDKRISVFLILLSNLDISISTATVNAKQNPYINHTSLLIVRYTTVAEFSFEGFGQIQVWH